MVSSSESGHSHCHWSVHSGFFLSLKVSPVAKLPLEQAGRGPQHSPQVPPESDSDITSLH